MLWDFAAASYQMFCARTMRFGCDWRLLCSSHLLKGSWVFCLSTQFLLSFPLFDSDCIFSYIYDGNFVFVLKICCHFTNEYCKKRRKVCLIYWGWRKITVPCSGLTSPHLSPVMHLTTSLKECFQQSASLLWMKSPYCSRECWKPPFFFQLHFFYYPLLSCSLSSYAFSLGYKMSKLHPRRGKGHDSDSGWWKLL